TVWQMLTWLGVAPDVYILTFAGLGLALLVCYRFAVIERARVSGLAEAAFACANALLLIASAAGALVVLGEVAGDRGVLHDNVLRTALLPAVLAAIGLASVGLMADASWRRVYVVTTVAHAGLTVMVLAVLSHLDPWHKREIVAVALGLLLL